MTAERFGPYNPRVRWVTGTRLQIAIIVLAGMGQRLLLFVRHQAALDALLAANPTWYTGQHLARPLLRDQLGLSLLYLQQTPPASNVIMGLWLKWFEWPTGVTYALIALEAVLAIVTALLLRRILVSLYPLWAIAATTVAIVFLLNTDLVVLEYNSFGQTFYEHLTMMLVILLVDRLLQVGRSDRAGDAAVAGTVVAALALSRASWSFFALPGALLVAWLSPGQRMRQTAAFLIPIIVLQGGWSLKNGIVYDRWSPTTSSWSGFNLANGLRAAGFGEEFRQFILAGPAEGDPERRCFIATFEQPPAAPAAVDVERDRQIEERLGRRNGRLNSAVMQRLFAECERSAVAFAAHEPGIFLRKTARAYRLFWEPPANYGRLFVGLFAVDNHSPNPMQLLHHFIAGNLPATEYVASGTYPRLTFSETSFYTLRWLDPIILVANLVGVHLLAPLALVAWVVTYRRGERLSALDTMRLTALAVLATVYVYHVVVVNVGEYGENMRFRIGVEPVIWLITIVSATRWLACGRQLRRRGGPSRA